MVMTQEQKVVFKQWLDSNAGNLNDEDAANLANQLASPDYIVWRTDVPLSEIYENDNFLWTQVDAISVSRWRIWEAMFRFGSINASKTNVRSGIDNAWQGTGSMATQRSVIYEIIKRKATNFEKLFASGNGQSATPSTLVLEGPVTSSDVSEARNA